MTKSAAATPTRGTGETEGGRGLSIRVGETVTRHDAPIIGGSGTTHDAQGTSRSECAEHSCNLRLIRGPRIGSHVFTLRGSIVRRPPVPIFLLTAAVVVAGAGTVTGPLPAEAAESPPPAVSTPTTAPSDPTTATDGSFVDHDPSLAEMNAAQNHTMGSTVPADEPAKPSTESQARELQAQAAFPPGVPGLDVSGWQENVDWASVWSQGARFAYVKATEGLSYKSGQFAQQYNGSYAVGMVRGAYHFARPDISSGAAQADYFVSNGGGWVGDSRTLPPLLDIEYNPYGDTCYGLTAGAMTSWIADFSARVKALTGANPAIYTTTDWWARCTGNSPAFGANPLFIARYPANISSGAGTLPAGWGAYTFWQYSSTGPFPGDSDVFNGSEATLKQLALTGLPMQQPVIGAGDLNGDGKPDLLARRPDGTLWYYAGAGGSSSGVAFVPGKQIGQGWGIFNQLIGAGDVTGDGRPDVLARKPDGSLWLYAGTGAHPSTGAGLAAGVRIGVGWDIFTDVTAAGDMDGDGLQDLLGRKPDGSLWRYSGAGSASYRPGVVIGSGWSVFSQITSMGDHDGDGRSDLVGLRSNGTLSLYRSAGPVYEAGRALPASGLAGNDLLIRAGDADGNGREDLFARSASGSLKFLSGTVRYDTAAFGNVQVVGIGWDVFRSVIGAGDLDGDGQPDVVAIDKNQVLWFYAGYGNKDGINRSYRTGVRIGQGWGAFTKVVDAGDFDGNGTRDLMAVRDDASLWLYPGTGTVGRNGVAYGAPVRLDAGAWTSFEQLVVADFDGDGRRDVVATKADGSGSIYRGAPRTTSSSPWLTSPVALGALAGSRYQPLSAGDANGDGRADLLATKSDGSLWFFGGTGTASGTSPFVGSPVQVGSGWTIFSAQLGTGDTNPQRGGDVLAVRPDGNLWYYPGTGQAGRGEGVLSGAIAVGAGWNVFG